MTHERDIERLLDTWFADGPREAPDRVLDDAASRIHRERQRPAWRLALRETPMNAYLKPILAIAAVIAVAVIGLFLLREPSGVAAPAPTPTPALSPTSAPTPGASTAFTCDDGTACAGPLDAGPHTTTAFEPAFTVTVPDGWVSPYETARTVNLHPTPQTFDVQVLSQLAIPVQNAACSAEKQPGAGNTVQDWVDFIENHPGLVANAAKPVTVGGYDGQRIQFRVADDWTGRCPDGLGPAVMVFTDSGEPPTRARWFDDHRVTVWLLDVAGTTVAIHVDSGPSLNANDADVATFQPILDSISFTSGG